MCSSPGAAAFVPKGRLNLARGFTPLGGFEEGVRPIGMLERAPQAKERANRVKGSRFGQVAAPWRPSATSGGGAPVTPFKRPDGTRPP